MHIGQAVLQVPTSPVGVPGAKSVQLLLTHLLTDAATLEVAGTATWAPVPPSTWKTCVECPVLGFGLAQSWLCEHLGSEQEMEAPFPLSPSPFSPHTPFFSLLLCMCVCFFVFQIKKK